MSAFEANNPFDLLGQATLPAPAVKLHGLAEPQLSIDWRQFHQGVAGNFAELFRRARVSKDFLSQNFFKDCWIERRLPLRAILAALLWHVVFLAMPIPQISWPQRNQAFANAQLTWSGPIQDFPLLQIPAAKTKATPRAAQNKAQNKIPALQGADAFHPRQTIFTDSLHPTHPRQTLINPAAPSLAPKILSNLPNMVQLAQSAAPMRPRIEISQQALKMLHPHAKRFATNPNAAAPEVQMSQQRTADFALAIASEEPKRPKLQLNTGAAPRMAPKKENGSPDPAPNVGAEQLSSQNGSGQTLIALSAAPGPAAPVAPPAGNLSARVTISPEGKKPGAPGGVPDAKPNSTGNPEHGTEHADSGANGGAGTSSTAVSISGGTPRSANVSSGNAAGKIAMPSSRPLYTRAEASRAAQAPEEEAAAPNFALLPPGAKPEIIFAQRRVYSMNVNMPNLNSATGSWILNFSEKPPASAGPRQTQDASGEIAEPLPLKKVDPKYPPTLMAEHVEGEVILYAMIRRDGSVDAIQVVKGIDPLLDANATRALAQWKFRPAERNGEPVDVEAIVHIPFHAPEQ